MGKEIVQKSETAIASVGLLNQYIKQSAHRQAAHQARIAAIEAMDDSELATKMHDKAIEEANDDLREGLVCRAQRRRIVEPHLEDKGGRTATGSMRATSLKSFGLSKTDYERDGALAEAEADGTMDRRLEESKKAKRLLTYSAIYNEIELRHRQPKEGEGEDRKYSPYGENIFFMCKKNYAHSRPDSYKVVPVDGPYPTLKVNTWFYKEDGATEFSLREYARVQTFPDNYLFVGPYALIKEQIGNAVAPDMGRYVAQFLKGKTFGDLFAGAGGLSCGLEQAGKKAVWAIEIKHRMTYRANHPSADLHTKDICKENPLDYPDVDIIVGGPPCQGFSLSGKRIADDPRNKLYREFIRFVKIKKPKEILMENVPQIEKVAEQIIEDFDKIGYRVEGKLIKGEEIGMLQHRDRFFFIGKRT